MKETGFSQEILSLFSRLRQGGTERFKSTDTTKGLFSWDRTIEVLFKRHSFENFLSEHEICVKGKKSLFNGSTYFYKQHANP
jgi:hypothetical protein